MRWAMAVFYAAAAYAHLSMPGFFMPIMPDWVPAPYRVVLFTGACEAAGAIGLVIPRTRRLAGFMLALYAVCVFPANIKHAFYGPAIPGLPNTWFYHGPRLLLQPVIVWWALYVGEVTDWPFAKVRSARAKDRTQVDA
jgi:uncharacterized membrane protein